MDINGFMGTHWDNAERIKIFVDILRDQIGLPYIWGGDCPSHDGFDCSGLALYGLRRIGAIDTDDRTAQGIYDKSKQLGYQNTECGIDLIRDVLAKNEGILIFYGKIAKKITHIAISSGQGMLIEAGGGGSRTTTAKKAIAQRAFVRTHGVWCRKDIVAVVDPFNRDVL